VWHVERDVANKGPNLIQVRSLNPEVAQCEIWWHGCMLVGCTRQLCCIHLDYTLRQSIRTHIHSRRGVSAPISTCTLSLGGTLLAALISEWIRAHVRLSTCNVSSMCCNGIRQDDLLIGRPLWLTDAAWLGFVVQLSEPIQLEKMLGAKREIVCWQYGWRKR